jgi:hypothetical protein
MNPRTYVSIVTTPIKQLSNMPNTINNNESACYLNKAQSNPNFYPAKTQNQPVRNSQMIIDNNFSAMTFKNVPEVEQSTPRRPSGTSQSIQLQDDQLLTNKNYSEMIRPSNNVTDSIIEPLIKSQFFREEPSQKLFR